MLSGIKQLLGQSTESSASPTITMAEDEAEVDTIRAPKSLDSQHPTTPSKATAFKSRPKRDIRAPNLIYDPNIAHHPKGRNLQRETAVAAVKKHRRQSTQNGQSNVKLVPISPTHHQYDSSPQNLKRAKRMKTDHNVAPDPYSPEKHDPRAERPSEMSPEDAKRSLISLDPSKLVPVPTSEVPHVSYQAYIALADLTSENRAALRQSKVYDEESCGGVPLPHKNPWPAINHNRIPVVLKRHVDTVVGKNRYVVVADKVCHKGDVLAVFGGVLTESSNLTQEQKDNDSVIMRADFLNAYFTYTGEELAVCADEHSTLAKYVRQPIYAETQEGNAIPDVVFDPRTSLFIVFFYATRTIQKDEEILALRHLGSWRSMTHRELYINARISHWHHAWATRLEQKLLANDVEPDTAIPLDSRAPRLSEDERRCYWANELDRITADLEIADMESMLTIEDQNEAYEDSGCAWIARNEYGSSITPETQLALKRKASFIPAAVFIHGKKYDIGRERVKHIITTGCDTDLVCIRELVDLNSSPRYYCPPFFRAWAVAAKQDIKTGTLICTYSGVLDEQVQNNGSMSAYNLLQSDCKTAFGNSYHAPDLILDAAVRGNIGKFINDCQWRGQDSESEEEMANVKVLWVYYDGSPHLIFYALRDIYAGEELIQSYGLDFWSVTSRQILVDHWRYHDYIFAYVNRLEELCEQHQLELPEQPPYLLESMKIFQHKPLSYPRKWKKDSHGASHKVEKILDSREIRGEIQYLIKWRMFPASLNSWEGRAQLGCEGLLDRFEVLQRLSTKQLTTVPRNVYKNGFLSERDFPQTDTTDDDSDDEPATQLNNVHLNGDAAVAVDMVTMSVQQFMQTANELSPTPSPSPDTEGVATALQTMVNNVNAVQPIVETVTPKVEVAPAELTTTAEPTQLEFEHSPAAAKHEPAHTAEPTPIEVEQTPPATVKEELITVG